MTPKPSAFRSPTEQNLGAPQTGQTESRLYRVGATQYNKADNEYGQITINNSVSSALSGLWSEETHSVARGPDRRPATQTTSAARQENAV